MTFDRENQEPLPGDRLRDEAAKLLSVKYGRPRREVLVKGKKVDLLFEISELGRKERIIVEAKDYNRNLSRNDVLSICNDYHGIIDHEMPGRLLIVTRKGLSPSAESFILNEMNRTRHMTIWQIEQEIFDLDDYVESLSTAFHDDGLINYYVDGCFRSVKYGEDGSRSLGDREDAFTNLVEWINSEQYKPVALLGGYGAGKSSLAKKLVSYQATEALRDPFARRPILIRLGEFSRFSSIEGLLGGLFTHDFPLKNFNVPTFLKLNEQGKFLIICDGFDEMKHAMSWNDFRYQLKEINKLTTGSAKLILLGRPSAFLSSDEHYLVLRGLKRSHNYWLKQIEWTEFDEFEISEFDDGQRMQFFERYLRYRSDGEGFFDEVWLQGRLLDIANLTSSDEDLFGKPVHARIIVELAANPGVDLNRYVNGVSRWQLYSVFFDHLIEREGDKSARRPVSRDIRYEFMSRLAYWLWENKGGSTSFDLEDVPDEMFHDLPLEVHGDSVDIKREMVSGSFLEKKSGDVFYFAHRSFAEFLVARRMADNVPVGRKSEVYSDLCKDGVLEFLMDAPDKRQFSSWISELQEAEGNISLNYLRFLINSVGGLESALGYLDPKSAIYKVISAFNDDVSIDDRFLKSVTNLLNSQSNEVFALAFPLYMAIYAMSRASTPTNQLEIVSIVLDRLFSRAEFDEKTAHASVPLSADGCRRLAAALFGSVSEESDERFFEVDWDSFAREIEKFGVGRGMTIYIPEFENITRLTGSSRFRFFDVLNRLSEDSRTMARSYFAKRRDLSGVFTRELRSSPRRLGKTNVGRV